MGNAGSKSTYCDGGATALPCHTISILPMVIGAAPQFSTCNSQLRMIGSPSPRPGPATGSPVMRLRITAPFELSPQLRFELNVHTKGVCTEKSSGLRIRGGADKSCSL